MITRLHISCTEDFSSPFEGHTECGQNWHMTSAQPHYKFLFSDITASTQKYNFWNRVHDMLKQDLQKLFQELQKPSKVSTQNPTVTPSDPVAPEHDPVAPEHAPVAPEHAPVAPEHDPVAPEHDPIAPEHEQVAALYDSVLCVFDEALSNYALVYSNECEIILFRSKSEYLLSNEFNRAIEILSAITQTQNADTKVELSSYRIFFECITVQEEINRRNFIEKLNSLQSVSRGRKESWLCDFFIRLLNGGNSLTIFNLDSSNYTLDGKFCVLANIREVMCCNTILLYTDMYRANVFIPSERSGNHETTNNLNRSTARYLSIQCVLDKVSCSNELNTNSAYSRKRKTIRKHLYLSMTAANKIQLINVWHLVDSVKNNSLYSLSIKKSASLRVQNKLFELLRRDISDSITGSEFASASNIMLCKLPQSVLRSNFMISRRRV